MGDIVQIDNGSQLIGQSVFLGGGIIRGEHNFFAPDAAFVGHQQLRQRGTVAAAALLMEELQDRGIGGGLHGEILPEAAVPCESGFQPPGVLPDTPFIIDVERRGVLGYDGVQLVFCYKGLFHWETSQFNSSPFIKEHSYFNADITGMSRKNAKYDEFDKFFFIYRFLL
ncbi:hypothetical protein SDC9_96490 [bioreactor metagenome]|uniref:Uncharacterized protein n=1 Tax=bioreactor metagenome TaxID=1076179 RepID=A0A645A999_9ZZZZ